MTVESTRHLRAWSPIRRAWSPFWVAVLVVGWCGACSGYSGGGSHATTTTGTTAVSSTVAPSTVVPSTEAPSTVAPTTVAPTTTTIPGHPVLVVPASVDPTGRTDVTDQLQRFVSAAPDRSVVQFRQGARYQVDGTLIVGNRNDLTIDGNGATMYAATRGKPDRSQWLIKDGTRIVFRNLKVRGANAKGGVSEGAYVRKLETQHGFRFEGVNGAELDHVVVTGVYGDFVYLGRDSKRVPTQSVWIHDSTFSKNGRQGIAVTAASDVIIERNQFKDTRRSTIDLEPNAHSWRVSNVFVLDNTVGKGRLLFIASHGQGPVDNIVISGNVLQGHALTIDAIAPGNDRRSNWVITDNTSDTSVHSRPLRFVGIDGILVRGNRQAVSAGQPVLVLNNDCGAQVSANDFGGGEIRRVGAECAAPLAIPAPPAIPGRGVTPPTTPPTVGPTTPPTVGPTTPPTVGPTTPVTVGPTTPVTVGPTPSTSAVPGGGGGGSSPVAGWLIFGLGACGLAALILIIRTRRARRPRVGD